jgi:two-component system, OmpR family, copper resistance phosphate regulon response regulator CusR
LRILIVEDDAKSAGYLKKGLSENGFVADTAHDGETALDLAASSNYQLIILDLLLPKKDGWSVLSSLRSRGDQTPVICLTARDRVTDRVRGLESGADDYLTKPFAFSELLARIKTLLRRAANRLDDTIRIGDLEIDLGRQKAIRAGERLDLTPKEFLLLSCLARRAGDVLSRTAIAEQVWNMNFDCDTNVVDVHVRRLRSKVDDPFPERLIHTIRGVGYVLRSSKG